MAAPSPTFRKLDEDFAIDGSVAAEQLAHLAQNYRSALYLCSDASGDQAAEGGFAAFQSVFPAGQTAQVAIVPSLPPFVSSEGLPEPILAMELFGRVATALDGLPRPTAIVCKSSTRASAIYATYKAVKSNTTADVAFAEATSMGLKFVDSAALSSWFRTVIQTTCRKSAVFFRQLFEKQSSTYTYLLADMASKEAVLIDPVLETVDRDTKLIRELGFELKFAINTHCHADHITGTGRLKSIFPQLQSAIAKASTAAADIHLVEGDRVQFGSHHLLVLATPGHTSGCLAYVLDDFSRVFTGDTLLVRTCGRTDFQGGSSSTLYHSVHDKLFRLPDSTKVFPAHDYFGHTDSSIGEEKKYNARLTKQEDEFVTLMANLNLPYPKKIDEALPANLKCGVDY